jgi:protein TonB
VRPRALAALPAAGMLAWLALGSGAAAQVGGAAPADAPVAAVGDRAPIPLVRISPDYPGQALAQGLEGRCTVDYVVLADGSVDPESIAADCTSELFVEPARRAVARWTYSPAVAEGAAVARTPLASVLTFALAE